jgi:ubiquinol-cytochrome c reductase subunit 6
MYSLICVQDEQAKAREACRATRNCLKFFDQLQSCNDRVSSRKKTAETCLEEVIDYVHCVDECVSPHISKEP